MRPVLHKLLTSALLATYVGISLLGQGLHLLTPEDEHHHHSHHAATSVAHTHADDCCEDHDHHHHDHDSTELAVAPADHAADSHSCEICEFLFQAVGEAPQIAVVPDLHPLVAVAATPRVEVYSQDILGLHAARGPPQLLS